ncbi:MAG: NAD-dependent epimerase/dehydratase family protein [Oligoflexia bacterium]|nr:NAD-dependent epimerase/dehydratase family protein [Oligoflexia bacterium]
MSKTALIAGSTGLVGQNCLNLLLKSEYYDRVIAVTRKDLSFKHPKLKVIKTSFDNLEILSGISADDVFSCLGTTIKKAGSKVEFYKIDFSYNLKLAEIMLKNGAKQFLIVSSLGANAVSPVFYSRVKGDLELALGKLAYECIHIFRPSLLLGDREDLRLGEKAAIKSLKFLGPFFKGPLKKWSPIEGEKVAKAMITAAQKPVLGLQVYENQELASFL